MDWKQEIFKRLDALGEKLGVAAGHIWQVLVRQSIVEGIASLVLAVLGIIGLIVAIKVIIWSQKTGEAKADANGDWPAHSLFWFCASLIGIVVSTISICINVYGCVTRLGNPEYFALEYIMSLFGK